jgi:hypothetical protein
MKRNPWSGTLLVACALLAPRLEAATTPRGPAQGKSYRHPGLYVNRQLQPASALGPDKQHERDALSRMGVATDSAFYEGRSGRLSSFILSQPLIPGTGMGNTLRWIDLGGSGPGDETLLRRAAWDALVLYLDRFQDELRLDPSELGTPRIAAHESGSLIQVYAARRVGGVPVRDSYLSAVINHGNLVLLGLETWAPVSAALSPAVGADEARAAIARHARPFSIASFGKQAHLELIPMARGEGVEYRLAWVVRATLENGLGSWEGLVDAADGGLIAFVDTNAYQTARTVTGGVYPLSNDTVPPDGIEQRDWPMPFAGVNAGGQNRTTTTGGVLGCATGTASTALTGPFVRMNDTCGTIDERGAASIDLGFGPTPQDTDCAVPAGHSGGDTKAARTGFYELNRVIEQGRGYLPANPWLTVPLTANTNIADSCNAFWNGTTVSFLRDNGSGCGNTGEIAGVFDHEWGHGLDDNGVHPMISRPGEGIADIHAYLRTFDSCLGRGYLKFQTCPGYGDPCDGAGGCTGFRNVDFLGRTCNLPHTVTYITEGFTSAQCPPGRPACPVSNDAGPCNRETHCEGAVVGESAWDLGRRDLTAPPFNLDVNTAHELTARLFFLGSQAVGDWYTCQAGGGCGASGGYLQILATDDDDGNLGNGTPHMTAIRAAFERHETHCASPAPVNSGCAGGPATAPTVAASPLDGGVRLSWTAVPGAARYAVYRTEGIAACSFGKARIAEVAGTSYADEGLLNGRPYSYIVLPVGPNSSCFGRASNCASATPVPGPNLRISDAFALEILGGDGDDFLDNCELANVRVSIENTGAGSLTNVRIVGVTPLTHPSMIVTTALPAPVAPSLAGCATANGSFTIFPRGLAFAQTAQIRVDLTADELAPEVRSRTVSIAGVESNWTSRATHTFHFDGAGLEGWTATGGTFFQQGGGAPGSPPFHVSSSEGLDSQCDVIRSPLVRLRGVSTLSLQNRHDIEGTSGGFAYDRANVGVVDVQNGTRTVIAPSGGQLYTLASATPNGTCGTTGQAGWNATSPGYPSFDASTWSSAALNPGGSFPHRRALLEIRYGTDDSTVGQGLDFDAVTLTDFDLQGLDLQPDTCPAEAVAPAALAMDASGNGVFQPGETVVMAPSWRNAGLQALSAAGSASGFTGPGGATYTIVDRDAVYGTIASGQSAPCTDCYSLAVSGTRPAPHWDATILETITPTSTTRSWTLHIGDSFADVPSSSPYYRFVETLLHQGVTGGCTASTYCPTQAATREQMPVFVLVSREGPGYTPPPCSTPPFNDVPVASPYCRWIQELAVRGVVGGCGGLDYCPQDAVARDTMAVFVLATLEGPGYVPPPCTEPPFDDVPVDSPFCPWIQELAVRGVVGGCGGGDYCPAQPVSREQMSVFLAVTFGLSLYGI